MTSLNLLPRDSCPARAIEVAAYALGAYPEDSKKTWLRDARFSFRLEDGSIVIQATYQMVQLVFRPYTQI